MDNATLVLRITLLKAIRGMISFQEFSDEVYALLMDTAGRSDLPQDIRQDITQLSYSANLKPYEYAV